MRQPPEYPFINENYKKYLLQTYEDTYYPEKIRGSGKVAYIERNYEMINKSDVCVMCYDEDYILPNRKSGTRIALKYAKKQGKRIINIG